MSGPGLSDFLQSDYNAGFPFDENTARRLLETWWAETTIQWAAPGCCKVWRSDDGLTGTCEIDLMGKVGAV